MRIYVFVFAVFLTFGGLSGGSLAAEEPMADAGLDQTVANGTAVQLDGSGSIHPDGQIDSYGWTVVDDDGETYAPECRRCERTQFVPPRPGQYEITLRVTGESGPTALDTLYLNVTDAGPEAHIDGPDRGTTDESVIFRVDAESPDVTLDRISWAVNDRTIDQRSVDGSGDQSEIRLTFPDADTYRIQAAVFDSNGRSTYVAQYVRIDHSAVFDPPDGSVPPDRSGSQILSERTSDVRITFSTDGFYRTPNAGARSADSSYIGTETDAVDIDGGENAPWSRSPIDGLWEAASAADGALSGQDRETLECEVSGIVDSCRQAAMQAERDGRTEAVRSPDQSGAFDRYGLEGVERIDGPDPTQLAGDTEATVVFVVQQGTEGTLDVVSETKEEAVNSAADGVSDLTEIADSATSTLLPDSTDEESGDSVDGIERLDETSSIFKPDSDTTRSTSSESSDSFTGSASSTIVGETTGTGDSTSGSRSESRRSSSDGDTGSSSTRRSGSSDSSDASISSAASSTLKRSSSGGGDGSMNEGRTGL